MYGVVSIVNKTTVYLKFPKTVNLVFLPQKKNGNYVK